MEPEIARIYGNKVRVRACGMCWQGTTLLIVNHKGITETDFWAPPGGGVEFGQSVEETLAKEFKEETGLIITPGKFLFGCEYIQKPIHSIELFYEVEAAGGKLTTGHDPEIQIITKVTFMEFDRIMSKKAEELHGIFHRGKTIEQLKTLSGFFRI